MEQAQFFEMGALQEQHARSGKQYFEFVRIPVMSIGIYTLPTGTTDLQAPHGQTELYYVIRGTARMRAGSEDRAVVAGSLILISPGVKHAFYAIEEELTTLVIFAPAESNQ